MSFLRKPKDKRAANIELSTMSGVEKANHLCSKRTAKYEDRIVKNKIYPGVSEQLVTSCQTDMDQARADRDDKRPDKERQLAQATSNLSHIMEDYARADLPKRPNDKGTLKLALMGVTTEACVWGGTLFTAGAGGLIPVALTATVIAVGNPLCGAIAGESIRRVDTRNTTNPLLRALYGTTALVVVGAAVFANYTLGILRDNPNALKADLFDTVVNTDLTLGGAVMVATGLGVCGGMAIKYALNQEWIIPLDRAARQYYRAKDAVDQDNPTFCKRIARMAARHIKAINVQEVHGEKKLRRSTRARNSQRPYVKRTQDKLKRFRHAAERELAQSKQRADTIAIGNPNRQDSHFDVNLDSLFVNTPTVDAIDAQQRTEEKALATLKEECVNAVDAILAHERRITADLSTNPQPNDPSSNQQFSFDDLVDNAANKETDNDGLKSA